MTRATSPGSRTSSNSARTDWRVPGVAAALVVSSALVWHASSSAFVATTSNAGSSISTGTVALSDNDSGSAMFTVTNMKPGQSETRCITVTYSGTLASNVELYAPVTAGALRPYLDVTVQEGIGATNAACTGFTPSGAQAFAGTLASMPSTYATGLGTWAPSGSATRSYRLVTTLQDNQAAMGGSAAGITFTWEAQST